MRSVRFLNVLLVVPIVATAALGGCALLPTARPSVPTPTVTPLPASSTATPATEAPSTTAAEGPDPTATEAATVGPTPAPTSTPSESTELVFASFDKPTVEAEPVIHHEEIAPDLSNVENRFILSEAQVNRLVEDGFVITPGDEKEFFGLYEQARYDNIPIFVTSDSLLHIYHLLFDKVLRTAEVEHFIPLLRDLNAAMLARTDELYRSLEGTNWEDPARRTVAFAGVASKLLAPDVQVPDYAAELVDAEVALIEDAAGIQPSPIFPHLEHGEDYTQYRPRGHYTKTDALKAYFKSMMWYGRMTFRLTTEEAKAGRDETRSALVLVHALRTAKVEGGPALDAWADLYSPTVFFVGRSDDLTVLQYGRVMDEVYGEAVPLDTLTDDQLLDEFIAEASKLPPPRILGIVIGDWEDVEEQTKGLRFMGQRFVPDAFIFRQLIYRNVGTRENRRGLPNGLDIPAAMGSERAYHHLDEMGETDYENYDAQMDKMQAWLSGLSLDEWTETLYNSWLYAFRPLLEVPGDGYPAFMTSTAWIDKQLSTVMGSFAELKHDTILYAKQAYAELGGAPPPPPPAPPRGYVEPVPEFYARLAALTEMTRAGLSKRGLLAEQDEASLRRLGELARSLQAMAEKELRGEPLTDEEYETIRFYGGELEHLTMASADTPGDQGPEGQLMPEEQPQAAVVADVATDPWPELVLELAIGRIDQLHAVVPLIEEDGSITLQVAKGGVFSYYEFEWPMNDRLTDEAWRQMVEEGETPPRPAWINDFFTQEGEHTALREGVTRYQKGVVNAFWFLEPNLAAAEGEIVQDMISQVETLQAEQRYQGRKLMGVDFRSFDRQADDLAVVTVRETWRDELFAFEDRGPSYSEPAIAERGPYTLDVTYTLERSESGRWEVMRVVCDDQVPDW